MSVKILQHQDPGKLEKLVNKTIAASKGDLRFHSMTLGVGMFVAVLESAPKPKPQPRPATKPKPQPATKPKH